MDSRPEGVILASENSAVIRTYPNLDEGAEPCFLSSTICAKQVKVSAELDLCLDNLYDLADVQALIAFHQTLAATAQTKVMSEGQHKVVLEYIKLARSMNFRPGQYLPATIEIERVPFPCVVHLMSTAKRRFFERSNRFTADIYVAGDISPDQIRGKLYRDVYWGKETARHCHSELATIVTIQPE